MPAVGRHRCHWSGIRPWGVFDKGRRKERRVARRSWRNMTDRMEARRRAEMVEVRHRTGVVHVRRGIVREAHRRTEMGEERRGSEMVAVHRRVGMVGVRCSRNRN